jgi:hypothetical protein
MKAEDGMSEFLEVEGSVCVLLPMCTALDPVARVVAAVAYCASIACFSFLFPVCQI